MQFDGEGIPVNVGPFQRELVPSRVGMSRQLFLPLGSDAQLLVGENPRRKRIELVVRIPSQGFGAEAIGVIVAATRAEAQDFRGAYLQQANGYAPTPFEYSGPLWVRPAALTDAAGIFTRFGPTTANDLFISYQEDDWSR